MLSVKGWTAEIMQLKERSVQLEKEKGITEKICEDQENELKVCMHAICMCYLVFKVFTTWFGITYTLQLQRSSQEELHQNLSKLSTEVSIFIF